VQSKIRPDILNKFSVVSLSLHEVFVLSVFSDYALTENYHFISIFQILQLMRYEQNGSSSKFLLNAFENVCFST